MEMTPFSEEEGHLGGTGNLYSLHTPLLLYLHMARFFIPPKADSVTLSSAEYPHPSSSCSGLYRLGRSGRWLLTVKVFRGLSPPSSCRLIVLPLGHYIGSIRKHADGAQVASRSSALAACICTYCAGTTGLRLVLDTFAVRLDPSSPWLDDSYLHGMYCFP